MMTHDDSRAEQPCKTCSVPTERAAGICMFCDDYQPPTAAREHLDAEPAYPLEFVCGLVAVARLALTDRLNAGGDLDPAAAVDVLDAIDSLAAATKLISRAAETQPA